MKPWLEQNGYGVRKLENLADLAGSVRGSVAAVISLAVVSDMQATPEEVYLKLRWENARIPVVFASLLPFEKAAPILRRLAQQAGAAADVVGVFSQPQDDAGLGKPQTFLYIAKEDLIDPERRQRAQGLLSRHLR